MSPPPPALLAILQETLPTLPPESFQDPEKPLQELGIDSLDKMSLLLGVQEHCGVEFTEPEIRSLRTLGDIAKHFPE